MHDPTDQLAAARDICRRFLEAAALLDGKTLPDLDPDAALREHMQRLADTGAVQYTVSIECDVRESGFYVVASGLDPRRFPETGHLDSEVRIKHLTPSWATLTVRLPGRPISVMLDRLADLIAEAGDPS